MPKTKKPSSEKQSAIRTQWNLGLLYKNENDPQIEKDTATFEKACADFESSYRTNQNYLNDSQKLFEALTAYEKLASMSEGGKPIHFFHYTKDLNSTDQKAESMMNLLVARLTKAQNSILFFGLSLGTIPEAKQKEFLKDPKLAHYKYFLERLFIEAKHQLSEPEEKILNLKSLPSYSLWVAGQEKVLNIQTVQFKGKQLPLPQAQNMLKDLPTPARRKLHDAITEKMKSVSYFAESEINAIYTNKKINDELRKFEKPYSATVLGHQTDEKTVEALCKAVTDHFTVSHNFYKVKAKLLKLKSLEYADRAASVGKNDKKISFEKQYEMLFNAFNRTDPQFGEILNSFVKNGQIDVFPKKGKTGGAYCSGAINQPTFVLLNDVGTADSLMTFGHEMGHAIHTELSKSQKPMYQEYTTAVAEVASTFFENIAFEELFETLSEKQKTIALHDRIQDDVQTIFRQVACFNFELELHQIIRAQGAISKEAIAELLNKHMKAYLGPLFKLKEQDGFTFVGWSHIRRFFYVYSYAYGQLISKALYARYKKDKSYLAEVKKFLSAGGSKSPEDIFKSIGIDTSKPEFFIEGLQSVQADIDRLKTLTK